MEEVPLDIVLNDSLTPTPSLILDFETISTTYNRFVDLFPGGLVYYAMKANANPLVVELVVNHGGGLEIASQAELVRALDAGAQGHQIICSNPIKHPHLLRQMQQADVYAVVVDSIYESKKLPGMRQAVAFNVRLAVDNTGSVLPLAGKFGVDSELALTLLDHAQHLGLQPIGFSFHVGSQCLSPFNWVNAIRACGEVWTRALERGHDLYFLDIGGGISGWALS
ncbi:hypothetical protein HC928_22460 [bacterium]|nr:hypothetical protein [bacterium]